MSDFYSELSPRLSSAELSKLSEKLMELLSLQVRRFTMSDSSSVPSDTAEAIFKSMCFCLGISGNTPPSELRRLSGCDLIAEFDACLSRLEKKAEYCTDLWQHVCQNMPPVYSSSMNDTLKSLGLFNKKYDRRFFACEIPADIDYQLAVPVSESLLGIDYVTCYLHSLYIENSFLLHFNSTALQPVLTLYCSEYSELLVNLFEPVANNALGLAVLSKPVYKLAISKGDLSQLYQIFENKNSDEIYSVLCGALDSLCKKGFKLDRYLQAYSAALAQRIAAVISYGGLGGIFFSS